MNINTITLQRKSKEKTFQSNSTLKCLNLAQQKNHRTSLKAADKSKFMPTEIQMQYKIQVQFPSQKLVNTNTRKRAVSVQIEELKNQKYFYERAAHSSKNLEPDQQNEVKKMDLGEEMNSIRELYQDYLQVKDQQQNSVQVPNESKSSDKTKCACMLI